MRELKFRAWDKEANVFIPQKQLKNIFFDIIDGKYGDRFIIQQYTIRKDKNGKEIYDGDIVNVIAEETYKENSGISDVVVSKEGTFVVRAGKAAESGLSLWWGGWESLEVIGNIHENKDLLK